MTCPFCSSWSQAHRNCGDGLIEGQLAPWRYFCRRTVEYIEIGSAAVYALDVENSPSERHRAVFWSRFTPLRRAA